MKKRNKADFLKEAANAASFYVHKYAKAGISRSLTNLYSTDMEYPTYMSRRFHA